jgi:hypothetical protein
MKPADTKLNREGSKRKRESKNAFKQHGERMTLGKRSKKNEENSINESESTMKRSKGNTF